MRDPHPVFAPPHARGRCQGLLNHAIGGLLHHGRVHPRPPPRTIDDHPPAGLSRRLLHFLETGPSPVSSLTTRDAAAAAAAPTAASGTACTRTKAPPRPLRPRTRNPSILGNSLTPAARCPHQRRFLTPFPRSFEANACNAAACTTVRRTRARPRHAVPRRSGSAPRFAPTPPAPRPAAASDINSRSRESTNSRRLLHRPPPSPPVQPQRAPEAPISARRGRDGEERHEPVPDHPSRRSPSPAGPTPYVTIGTPSIDVPTSTPTIRRGMLRTPAEHAGPTSPIRNQISADMMAIAHQRHSNQAHRRRNNDAAPATTPNTICRRHRRPRRIRERPPLERTLHGRRRRRPPSSARSTPPSPTHPHSRVRFSPWSAPVDEGRASSLRYDPRRFPGVSFVGSPTPLPVIKPRQNQPGSPRTAEYAPPFDQDAHIPPGRYASGARTQPKSPRTTRGYRSRRSRCAARVAAFGGSATSWRPSTTTSWTDW